VSFTWRSIDGRVYYHHHMSMVDLWRTGLAQLAACVQRCPTMVPLLLMVP
jgi:hypothetical protein